MTTPAQGPYTVGKPEMMRYDWRCEIFTPTDFSVGFAFGNTEAECLANAYLLAASWEMREAIRAWSDWENYSGDDDDIPLPPDGKLLAALRKAEGSEK